MRQRCLRRPDMAGFAALAWSEVGIEEKDGRTLRCAAAFGQRDEVWRNTASGIAKGQPSAT